MVPTRLCDVMKLWSTVMIRYSRVIRVSGGAMRPVPEHVEDGRHAEAECGNAPERVRESPGTSRVGSKAGAVPASRCVLWDLPSGGVPEHAGQP